MNKTLLIADDDADIRLALSLLFSANGYRVIEACDEKSVITSASRHNPDLILLDMNFSRDTTSGQEGLALVEQLSTFNIPIILMTAWGSIELAVKGLQLGAGDFIEKPWQKERLLNSVEQQLKLGQLSNQNRGYKQLLKPNPNDLWISQSSSMQHVDNLVAQISATDANVLILGENGTGKSLLARRIHQASNRASEPMVEVNMGAIPQSLFESELFGHQKGAFTDAKESRIGRFELANNATLFLDEIGTLPTALQPKLLRVLETGAFETLGTSNTQHTNARIISATNADLNELVTTGEFRQDLLYRLNTFVIQLPPLRERIEDIAELALGFIARFTQKYQKGAVQLSQDAIAKLNNHQWPGNVRELQHVIERAVLLCQTEVIEAEQITIDNSNNSLTQPVNDLSLERNEIFLINQAMAQSQGQVATAAKLLGISRNSLYRRLDKFEISYEL